jgi:RNA polymerase sigma-70 factor (ECF subfamily)
MRSLARSLVNDAASADDVVQEAMVVALRRPPASGRSLRSWLSSVVSNVASNLRRGEQRLADRHARRGADDDATDPAATLERLDTHRLIVDLVRELDEPLRSTIVFFYFEGLTSPEIGRRMGVSDATVRSRIHKALNELRTRLQRKFGSREAWCALLLPLAPSLKLAPTTAAATNLTAGALTMGALSKTAVVAVALSLVGAGWRFVHERAAHEPTVAAIPQSSEIQEPLGPIAPEVSEREALAQESDPASLERGNPQAKAGEASIVSSSTYGLRARFVDSAGKPWEGVLFRVLEGKSWGLSEESITSGVDGRVEMSFAILDTNRNPNLQFVAARTGCATRAMHVSLIVGGVVDLGNVVLEREARVRGTVQDPHGAGLGDVTVGLSPLEILNEGPDQLRRKGSDQFDKLIITRSDTRGDFELAAVAAGKWRLWGHREGFGYGISEPFEVLAGEEEAGVDFKVPDLLATDTIRGVVVDPSGKPAARAAFVTFAWETGYGSNMTSCFSGTGGSFEILVNAETPGDLRAEDRERRWTSDTKHGVPPGARDIVLQLAEQPPARVLRLRVHGPGDEPVGGITLTIYNSFVGRPEIPREIEAGLYEFPVPDSFFKLTVAAAGYVDGKLELEPQGLPAQLDLGLEGAPALRGRVSAAGRVVPAAAVEALAVVRKGQSLTVNGFPALMSSVSAPSVTTSEIGTFVVFLQGQSPVYLRCVAPGFAPTIVGPIDVESSPTPIEIELTTGGSLAGRARDKDGTPVAGAIVGVTCGDGYPRTMRSGLDGAFRFDGLSAGPWLVLERDEEVTDARSTSTFAKDRRIEWSTEVAAGRTTYFDLILQR